MAVRRSFLAVVALSVLVAVAECQAPAVLYQQELTRAQAVVARAKGYGLFAKNLAQIKAYVQTYSKANRNPPVTVLAPPDMVIGNALAGLNPSPAAAKNMVAGMIIKGNYPLAKLKALPMGFPLATYNPAIVLRKASPRGAPVKFKTRASPMPANIGTVLFSGRFITIVSTTKILLR